MDLRPYWAHIEEVVDQRLAHNKTARHVAEYGRDIEVLGAAGELAALIFLGLEPMLHKGFDGGCDIRLHGLTIDVKATHMKSGLAHRFLQWPTWKTIKSDIILMTAVSLEQQTATVLGYALSSEILKAPVNENRARPCHEIPVKDLHPAWVLPAAITARQSGYDFDYEFLPKAQTQAT